MKLKTAPWTHDPQEVTIDLLLTHAAFQIRRFTHMSVKGSTSIARKLSPEQRRDIVALSDTFDLRMNKLERDFAVGLRKIQDATEPEK